jgi:hypothetical protein
MKSCKQGGADRGLAHDHPRASIGPSKTWLARAHVHVILLHIVPHAASSTLTYRSRELSVGPMCWSRRSAGLSCRDPKMHESQFECLGRAACGRRHLLRAKAAGAAAAAATAWRWKSKSRAWMGVERRSHDCTDLRKIARRYCWRGCQLRPAGENLCANPLPLLWAHTGLERGFRANFSLLFGRWMLPPFLACSHAQASVPVQAPYWPAIRLSLCCVCSWHASDKRMHSR